MHRLQSDLCDHSLQDSLSGINYLYVNESTYYQIVQSVRSCCYEGDEATIDPAIAEEQAAVA